MDEVSIYNTILPAAQIQAGMSSSAPVITSGLVAYYKMDENGGAVAIGNTMGNRKTGILHNQPRIYQCSGQPLFKRKA